MSQQVLSYVSPPRCRLVRCVATAAHHPGILGDHYVLCVSQASRCKHPMVRRFIEAPFSAENSAESLRVIRTGVIHSDLTSVYIFYVSNYNYWCITCERSRRDF